MYIIGPYYSIILYNFNLLILYYSNYIFGKQVLKFLLHYSILLHQRVILI